jgi:plasmid stability protein
LMPFVKGKMELAHRDICRKVIEKVEMQRRQIDLAQSVGRSLQVNGAGATQAETVAPEQQVAELHAPGSQKIFYA